MNFTGLSQQQVLDNRAKHGRNALTDVPPKPLWLRILKGFTDPMIMILMVALVIQLMLFFFGKAEWYEPFGVFVAIIIANGVAAIFEHKQEGKASALKHATNAKEKTKVVRDGILQEIALDEVVVGDIVFLQSGDKIPADGVLREGALKVDQAALNGESDEATKVAQEEGQTFNVKDLLNPCYIYRGTVICSGEAYEEVQSVGDNTIFGQAALAAQEPPRDTPLQLKLGHLAKQITRFGYVGAVAIIAIVLLHAVFSGNAPQDWSGWLKLILDAVTVAVTIIVCAVPEGLPMLSSILQAIQSLKMVKDNVLVRKINGLETAGSLSLLFSDKTGTITEGKLSVVELTTGNGTRIQDPASLSPQLLQALIYGIGANNSAIASNGKVLGGNGTDRALMTFLMEHNLTGKISKADLLESRPFDSNKKCSSILVKENDATVVYWKGAPERILERCNAYLDDNGVSTPLESTASMMAYLDEQAARSMRLLAVAKAQGAAEDAPLTLVCVICIRDNVRKEVHYAVEEIHGAGIQVVMVTGDRRETAVAIAKEAGLLNTPDDIAMTSFELAEKSDDEMKEILPHLRVVSRALPLDKSRLVRLAQERDMVVGMTGDGVNDAPALRRADVGFAMGSGTEVAKEAGEITILDDNLSSIEKAILYGRTMFKSIRKFLIFQLTVNVAAVFTCAIGPLFGENVVMTVIQLLLVNLAMDTLAAMAYGSEPPLKEYMCEPPVPRNEQIVTKGMLTQVLLDAGYITLLCLGILFVPCVQKFIGIPYMDGILDSTYCKAAVFATFMMAITFNGFNARTEHLNPFEGIERNLPFLAIMGIIFAMQFVFVTFGGEALSVKPLSPETWFRCLFLALLVIPIDILRKMLCKR